MKVIYKYLLFSCVSLCFSWTTKAQDEALPKWQLNGYLKEMVTLDWSEDQPQLDNLLHQRLNFKWFPSSHVNVYLELRSRLFFGKSVSEQPFFGDLVDVNNDYFDLSLQFPKKQKWLFHSMLDRAYLEWYKDDWEVRLGRQRINWGVNLVWNPNDLFNAYSYFDFDYTERPGSDALLVKKYLGFASSIELAASMADDFDDMTLASMFRWNKWNYDFQVLAAKAREDLTVGVGWAGNLGTAGFKGEAAYFYPYRESSLLDAAVITSISADYAFQNTLYLHAAVLYNSEGTHQWGPEGLSFFSLEPLTVRSLSPFPWSVFLQSTYELHPLLRGGMAVIYFPGSRNALFLNPSLDYSMSGNWDLSLIVQWYYDKWNKDYQALARLVYLRAKYSF